MILERLERQYNQVLDAFEFVSGVPNVGGRYPERKKVTMTGTFNTIRIDRSNIGAVNTGSIESVQVSLAGIQQGDPALAAALKQLAEAVINSPELQPAQKNDAVQMLETVAAEAVPPHGKRRSAVMRAVLSGFAETVKAAAALATLWERLGPVVPAAL